MLHHHRRNPYQFEDNEFDGNYSPTGTLKMGRVVWAKEPQEQAPDYRISVYVEGIGLVFVASRLLRRTSVKL